MRDVGVTATAKVYYRAELSLRSQRLRSHFPPCRRLVSWYM